MRNMRNMSLALKGGLLTFVGIASLGGSVVFAELPVKMEETQIDLPASYEDYPYDRRYMSDAYMGRNYQQFQPFKSLSMKRIFAIRNDQLENTHDYIFGIDQQNRLYLSADRKAPFQIKELTGAKEVHLTTYGGYYVELQDGTLWYADFAKEGTKTYPKPKRVETKTKQVVLVQGDYEKEGYFTIDGNNNLVLVDKNLKRKTIDQGVDQLGATFDLLSPESNTHEYVRGIYYVKNNQLWAYTPFQESEKQMLCDKVTQLSDRYFYWNDRQRMVNEVATSYYLEGFQIEKSKDLPSAYKQVTFNRYFAYARTESTEKKGLFKYIIQESVMGEKVFNDTKSYPDIFVNPWKTLPELQNLRDLTSTDHSLYLLNEKGQVYSLGNGQVYEVSPF